MVKKQFIADRKQGSAGQNIPLNFQKYTQWLKPTLRFTWHLPVPKPLTAQAAGRGTVGVGCSLPRVGGQLPPSKRWLDTTVLPNSTCDPWCAGVSCVHTTCKTFLKWIELVVQTGLSKRRNCWLYRNVIPCGCEGTPKIYAKYVCLSVLERLFPSLMSSQMWEKTCRQCTAMLP